MNISGAQHNAATWVAFTATSESTGQIQRNGRTAEPSRDTVSLSALGQQLGSRDLAGSFGREGSAASPNQAHNQAHSQAIYSAQGRAQAEVQGASSNNDDISQSNGQQREQADEKPAEQSIKNKKEQQAEAQKQETIRDLAARDREVRAHEQAHAAVGGSFAGAPKYQFERGPDGVNYAVGGEVPIDVSPAATPEQTIAKAQTIRRAALAPAEPSPQDRRVAQESTRLEAEARQEMRAQSLHDKQGSQLEAAQAGEPPVAPEKASADSASPLDSVGAPAPSGPTTPPGAPLAVNSQGGSNISSADAQSRPLNNGADIYRALSRLTGETSSNEPLGHVNNNQATLLDAMA